MVKPSRRGPTVERLIGSYLVSERRACRVLRLPRATYRYRSCLDPRTELRMRIREIAPARVRYGYRKIRVLLNREGWNVGKYLVYRLYKEEGFMLKRMTIVDVFTREAVAIDAGQRRRGDDVVRTLNRLKSCRGVPKVLLCDHGSAFTSQAMDLWAYRNGVKIDFSRPGANSHEKTSITNGRWLKGRARIHSRESAHL